jgi:hypothetical protein
MKMKYRALAIGYSAHGLMFAIGIFLDQLNWYKNHICYYSAGIHAGSKRWKLGVWRVQVEIINKWDNSSTANGFVYQFGNTFKDSRRSVKGES